MSYGVPFAFRLSGCKRRRTSDCQSGCQFSAWLGLRQWCTSAACEAASWRLVMGDVRYEPSVAFPNIIHTVFGFHSQLRVWTMMSSNCTWRLFKCKVDLLELDTAVPKKNKSKKERKKSEELEREREFKEPDTSWVAFAVAVIIHYNKRWSPFSHM